MKKVCKSQAWGEWFTNFSSILPKSQSCVSTSHGYFDEKVSLHLSSVGLSYGVIISAGRGWAMHCLLVSCYGITPLLRLFVFLLGSCGKVRGLEQRMLFCFLDLMRQV